MTLYFPQGFSVENPDALVSWYNGKNGDQKSNVRLGQAYYGSSAVTGQLDTVGFGDLSWAVLMNGQPRGNAAFHLLNLLPISLIPVPIRPLHTLSPLDIEEIVNVLTSLIGNGVACAIASKMTHPKRKHAVPVLDNGAIFGSFANDEWASNLPNWNRPLRVRSTKGREDILAALLKVQRFLADPANQQAWDVLQSAWPQFTRVELFDMCWWTLLKSPATRVQAGTA